MKFIWEANDISLSLSTVHLGEFLQQFATILLFTNKKLF